MDSPIGRLGIAQDATGISDVFFAGNDETLVNADGKGLSATGEGSADGFADGTAIILAALSGDAPTPLLRQAVCQLNEYFQGARETFDLPLSYQGTSFQKAVWEALLDIPYGQVRSYKDVAEGIGRGKACRAVGMANNRNPIVIIIPCHRVIGHNGALVGYGGGIAAKEYLLELERKNARLPFPAVTS